MSVPILKIGSLDITEKVAGITPSNNDLDADGSGRDIHTGTMKRKKIADKDKLDVAMLRMWEGEVKDLKTALNHEFVSVKYLCPGTNTQVTKNMYCSSINYGIQMYSRSKQQTYYAGVTFSLTEK